MCITTLLCVLIYFLLSIKITLLVKSQPWFIFESSEGKIPVNPSGEILLVAPLRIARSLLCGSIPSNIRTSPSKVTLPHKLFSDSYPHPQAFWNHKLTHRHSSGAVFWMIHQWGWGEILNCIFSRKRSNHGMHGHLTSSPEIRDWCKLVARTKFLLHIPPWESKRHNLWIIPLGPSTPNSGGAWPLSLGQQLCCSMSLREYKSSLPLQLEAEAEYFTNRFIFAIRFI